MNLATLADRNLAEYGEYERLVFEGRTFTNRDLHDKGARLAAALKGLGLKPGHKVVVMMINCPEVLMAYPGIWRAGMVAIPVLFLLEEHRNALHLAEFGSQGRSHFARVVREGRGRCAWPSGSRRTSKTSSIITPR